MVVDHTINNSHISLNEHMQISNYSLVKFLLLYQTAAFSTQVRQISLDLTDAYFDLEDAVNTNIELINDNGGFTVSGWYKRGEINDRTIVHQNNSTENIQKNNNAIPDNNAQVDNSKIIFHPCVIRATNSEFYKDGSVLNKKLFEGKYDVGQLLHE